MLPVSLSCKVFKSDSNNVRVSFSMYNFNSRVSTVLRLITYYSFSRGETCSQDSI